MTRISASVTVQFVSLVLAFMPASSFTNTILTLPPLRLSQQQHTNTNTPPSPRSTTTLPSTTQDLTQTTLSDTTPNPLILHTPLPPQSFAGAVERAITNRFGASPAARILQSWRLLDAGYEHVQHISPRDAKNCYQHASSYVPSLSVKKYWENEELEWTSKLESHYPAIKREFMAAISDAQSLEEQGNNVWAGALTNDAAGYGVGWSTLVLYDRGSWDDENTKLFPQTSRAILDCGIPACEVFFASMQPGSSIAPHSDFTNFVLTSHLGLVIPKQGEKRCKLTIGDEEREWHEGEISVFDTSVIHEAVNETDETRYILMMRLWHPDLTEVEREALQFTYDCLEVPELTSDDPGMVFMAEQHIKMLRSVPELLTEDVDVTELIGKKKKKDKKYKKKKKKSGTAGKGFGA
mmetsp:Transcript_13556/g.16604  ORF Transcript_13556/g.16604 Transcript_13556/m.16604 type:complete len:408 (-) Transcript_13556:424-1647(-)